MPSIYTDQYRRVIDLLVEARKAAGVSQQELADELSRPQSFVSKVERCDRRLDIVEFAHICRLIGTDATSMLEKAGLISATKPRSRKKRPIPARPG